LSPLYNSPSVSSFGTEFIEADRWIWFDRAIMTIVIELPGNAYVKGGLFARSGFEIPPPGLQQFWRSCEKWEEPLEGVRLVQ
jgi:hypothetical protein